MYNAGKVEALANSKTETNAFSREPQQTKSRVIFFFSLFFFFCHFFPGTSGHAGRRTVLLPFPPSCFFFLFLFCFAAQRERCSPGHRHTRRHTEKATHTHSSCAKRGPRTCGETQRSRQNQANQISKKKEFFARQKKKRNDDSFLFSSFLSTLLLGLIETWAVASARLREMRRACPRGLLVVETPKRRKESRERGRRRESVCVCL